MPSISKSLASLAVAVGFAASLPAANAQNLPLGVGEGVVITQTLPGAGGGTARVEVAKVSGGASQTVAAFEYFRGPPSPPASGGPYDYNPPASRFDVEIADANTLYMLEEPLRQYFDASVPFNYNEGEARVWRIDVTTGSKTLLASFQVDSKQGAAEPVAQRLALDVNGDVLVLFHGSAPWGTSLPGHGKIVRIAAESPHGQTVVATGELLVEPARLFTTTDFPWQMEVESSGDILVRRCAVNGGNNGFVRIDATSGGMVFAAEGLGCGGFDIAAISGEVLTTGTTDDVAYEDYSIPPEWANLYPPGTVLDGLVSLNIDTGISTTLLVAPPLDTFDVGGLRLLPNGKLRAGVHSDTVEMNPFDETRLHLFNDYTTTLFSAAPAWVVDAEWLQPECFNRRDDDGDGFVDAEDRQCAGVGDDSENSGAPPTCSAGTAVGSNPGLVWMLALGLFLARRRARNHIQ